MEVTPLAAASLAADRTLPLAVPLRPLLGDTVTRGHTISCHGPAAVSLATAVLVEATSSGAWLALVGVPTLGLEALAGAGVPLERVVRVDPPAGRWLDTLGTAVDGFDLVVTRILRHAPGEWRRLQARLRSRGSVLVLIEPSTHSLGDLTLAGERPRWAGIGAGHGHLAQRTLTVTATGRRRAVAHRAELQLPDPAGRIASVDVVGTAEASSELLREVG